MASRIPGIAGSRNDGNASGSVGLNGFGGIVLDGIRSEVGGKGRSRDLLYRTGATVGGQRRG